MPRCSSAFPPEYTSFPITPRPVRGFFCSSTSARYFHAYAAAGLLPRLCGPLWTCWHTEAAFCSMGGACLPALRPACASRRHWEYFHAEKPPLLSCPLRFPWGPVGAAFSNSAEILCKRGRRFRRLHFAKTMFIKNNKKYFNSSLFPFWHIINSNSLFSRFLHIHHHRKQYTSSLPLKKALIFHSSHKILCVFHILQFLVRTQYIQYYSLHLLSIHTLH